MLHLLTFYSVFTEYGVGNTYENINEFIPYAIDKAFSIIYEEYDEL